MDKTEEFHVPLTFATFIKQENKFTIIFPEECPAMFKVNLDTIIRAIIISDDEFAELKEGLPLDQCTPLGKIYYNVDYIRLTRLRNVTSKEWNYSTYINQENFSKSWSRNPNSSVRIISLNKEKLSLKELNKYYQTQKESNG